MQLPTVLMAVVAASPRDPGRRKRKCGPDPAFGGCPLCAAEQPPASAMDCYTANWNPLGDSAFYR